MRYLAMLLLFSDCRTRAVRYLCPPMLTLHADHRTTSLQEAVRFTHTVTTHAYRMRLVLLRHWW